MTIIIRVDSLLNSSFFSNSGYVIFICYGPICEAALRFRLAFEALAYSFYDFLETTRARRLWRIQITSVQCNLIYMRPMGTENWPCVARSWNLMGDPTNRLIPLFGTGVQESHHVCCGRTGFCLG